MSFSNCMRNQPKMPVWSSNDPTSTPGWPARAKARRPGVEGDQEGLLPDFHKNKVPARPGRVRALASPPLDDRGLDLLDQRNIEGLGSPVKNTRFDDPIRSNKPPDFGIAGHVYNVHLHLQAPKVSRKGDRVKEARSQAPGGHKNAIDSICATEGKHGPRLIFCKMWLFGKRSKREKRGTARGR